jgi:hypothetical protein
MCRPCRAGEFDDHQAGKPRAKLRGFPCLLLLLGRFRKSYARTAPAPSIKRFRPTPRARLSKTAARFFIGRATRRRAAVRRSNLFNRKRRPAICIRPGLGSPTILLLHSHLSNGSVQDFLEKSRSSHVPPSLTCLDFANRSREHTKTSRKLRYRYLSPQRPDQHDIFFCQFSAPLARAMSGRAMQDHIAAVLFCCYPKEMPRIDTAIGTTAAGMPSLMLW